MVLIMATTSLGGQSRVYFSFPFVILALEVNVKGCKTARKSYQILQLHVGTKICSKFLKSS